MKFILLLSILFSNKVYCASSVTSGRFETFKKRKMYYSAYQYLKEAVKKKNKIDEESIEIVLRNIHPSVLKNDKELKLLGKSSEQLHYAKGLHYFFRGKFAKAKTSLFKVKKRSSLYPETSFLLSVIYYSSKKYKKSVANLKRCVTTIKNIEEYSKEDSIYKESLKNRCLLALGRIYFEQKKYEKALKFQNKLKKVEAVWPHVLLDKAWTYYWLGRYEQALGSLLTYQVPILKRFLWPEVQYLRALTYYDLCYFEKVDKIYENYENQLYPLRTKLLKYKSKKVLRKLIKRKVPPKGRVLKKIYEILKSHKKDAKYSQFKKSLRRIDGEIKFFKNKGLVNRYNKAYESLLTFRKILIGDFENYLAYLLKTYHQELLRFKKHFSKLKLELGIKKRKFIVKSKKVKFIDDFSDLDLDNIEAAKNKFIWEFKGGFWADELGDYAVAVESNCKNEK